MFKKKLAALALAVSAAMTGVGIVATNDVVTAPAAEAASATRWVYCSADDYARMTIRNTSGSTVSVQVWSYDGTRYIGSRSQGPYTTATYSGIVLGPVQFRIYSATWGWSTYTYCT